MPSKYASVDEYYSTLPAHMAAKSRETLGAVLADFPQLKMKLAWNQPMLYLPGDVSGGTDKYVCGMSATTNWLLYNPFSTKLVKQFADRLNGYHFGTLTIRIMPDWEVDRQLLHDLTVARLAEIDHEIAAKAAKTSKTKKTG